MEAKTAHQPFGHGRPTIQALVLPGSIDKPPLGAHDPSL
jgi:hypothetical protein